MGVTLTCSGISNLKNSGISGPLHFPSCFKHVFSLIFPNAHLLVAYNIVLSIQDSASRSVLGYSDG